MNAIATAPASSTSLLPVSDSEIERPSADAVAVPDRIAADRIAVPDQSKNLGNRLAYWLLQASHRIGAIALFATLATWAMMYSVKNFHWPLAGAAMCSDIGMCLALLARMIIRHNGKLRREANGVAIFNLVLFILSIYLIIFARLSVIRANAAEFFTPTEQHP